MTGTLSAGPGSPLGLGGLFSPVPLRTSACTANPGEFIPVSTVSGPVTVTLPGQPADGTTVAVQMTVQGGSNAVTVAASRGDVLAAPGGPASLSLAVAGQGVMLQYRAPYGAWYALPGTGTGPGGVTSVNGHAGPVVLGAPDVGAVAKAGDTMTGHLAPASTVLAQSGGLVAVNAALGNDFDLLLAASGWTISAPSNAVNKQAITFALQQPASGGPCTVNWATGVGGFDFGGLGTGLPPVLSTTANAIDLAGFKYLAATGRWSSVGAPAGFTRPPIAFQDAASAQSGAGSSATVSIPSDVQAGALVLIAAASGSYGGGPTSLAVTSSGPVQPQQVGTTQAGGTSSLSQLWALTASGVTGSVSPDAGAVITITGSGATPPYDVCGAVSAYASARFPVAGTYASSAPADATSVTAPSLTTPAGGCWAVEIGITPANGGLTVTVPAGLTGRTATGNQAVFADSAASAGPSGTTVGGGTWSENGGAVSWHTWTVVLVPA
jgi:hypothetical protein